MDVIDTRTDLVRVAVLLEGLEKLHVALRRLNRDDISVKTLDGGEDIVKVGVAEVGVSLELISDTSSGELEGVDGPFEIGIPVSATKRKLTRNQYRSKIARSGNTHALTDGRLIDLDGVDTCLLEVDNFVT